VDRRDLITLAAGIGLVVLIAVAGKYAGLLPSRTADVPEATPVVTASSTLPGTLSTGTPSAIPSTTSDNPVPYRILYSEKPLDFPVFLLPEHLEVYGASDIMWRDPDVVPFAYIEESRSGLTQEFSFPYGVWGMNVTVFAVTKPQYARFEMALCYARDGKVIEGMELSGPGSEFRSVQVSNTGLYMIIHIENIDAFRITFITPRTYYTGAGEP
jgi:hypothetical protein